MSVEALHTFICTGVDAAITIIIGGKNRVKSLF